MTIQVYEIEDRHKKALSKIGTNLITPQEFLALYPDFTYKELAQICKCSERSVKRWFGHGKTAGEPKIHYLLWLTLAHHCLQRVEQSYRQKRQNQLFSR